MKDINNKGGVAFVARSAAEVLEQLKLHGCLGDGANN